jgi:hypothetical protein
MPRPGRIVAAKMTMVTRFMATKLKMWSQPSKNVFLIKKNIMKRGLTYYG